MWHSASQETCDNVNINAILKDTCRIIHREGIKGDMQRYITKFMKSGF